MEPKKNTPTGKGIRTGIQAFFGTAITLIVGLVVVVWNVPGVPHAVLTYLNSNVVPIIFSSSSASAIVSGLIAYYQNKLGK